MAIWLRWKGVRLFMQHCISKALDSLRQRGYNVLLKCEQRQSIIQLFCNRDVIAILPTGFGKSMIYIDIVYVLARDEWLKICGNECGCSVLIVSPLRSITDDQIAFLLSLNYTAKELANKSIADIIKSPPQFIYCKAEEVTLWLRHIAAIAVFKAIELIFVFLGFFPGLHAPRKQLIQKGHHNSTSWRRTLFEN
jgi:hypothetical protein